MFCPKCGNEMGENEKFCRKCGTENKEYDRGRGENETRDTPVEVNNHYNIRNDLQKSGSEERCLPAFILGLIGSIMGIFGGFCVTMCVSVAGLSGPAFIFIFGGSIVGLIGSCLCLKNVKLGSALELIGAVMIIILRIWNHRS